MLTVGDGKFGARGLHQSELECDGRPVVQRDCIDIRLVRREALGGDVEDPLLIGRVPPECSVRVVRIDDVLDICGYCP